jgi:hypothetical protein
MLRRRRPLLRAAMIGGGAYVAGRKMQQSSEREAGQEERLAELEAERGATAPAPSSAPASGSDLVARLKELSELRASGALSDEEFDAAKAKILAG